MSTSLPHFRPSHGRRTHPQVFIKLASRSWHKFKRISSGSNSNNKTVQLVNGNIGTCSLCASIRQDFNPFPACTCQRKCLREKRPSEQLQSVPLILELSAWSVWECTSRRFLFYLGVLEPKV